MDGGPKLYDYDQAAERIHFAYAPETIAAFCDRGILTRGEHFIVRAFPNGRFIWRVRLITESGILALIDRASHPMKRIYERARSKTHPDTAEET